MPAQALTISSGLELLRLYNLESFRPAVLDRLRDPETGKPIGPLWPWLLPPHILIAGVPSDAGLELHDCGHDLFKAIQIWRLAHERGRGAEIEWMRGVPTR